ncbi:MAG TPA: SbcC/MukB-like Walker B domain-containing protein, partial [Pseudonocardiaceae bacterium]|nr:SbcC/MukB-like Walker B domain-containing protein [Pseudonocardiaceae bacterium]
ADAETADTEARQRRAAAPERGPLERVRSDHAELAAALTSRPRAEQAHARARAVYDDAVTAAAAAAGALEDARATRERAVTDLAAAREETQRLAGERACLAQLRVPAGLEDLDGRRRAAEHELAAADQALGDADQADTDIRAQRSAAPERGPLERARENYEALASTQRALGRAEEKHTAAIREREAASTAAEYAQGRLRQARVRHDHQSRADLAAALRPSLTVGQPCPVCDHTVTALPPPRPAADLTSAQAAVAEAEDALERARRAEADTLAAEREHAGEHAWRLAEADRLRAALAGAPPSPAAVSEALVSLDSLAATEQRVAATLRDARRRRDEAASAVDALRREAAAAQSALWQAREPLAPLGAPPVAGPVTGPAAGDVLAGWRELCAWAQREAAARDTALADARVTAAQAAEAMRSTQHAFDQAERAAADRRAEETAAARAEQRSRSELDALDQRIERLQAALASAPSDAEAHAALNRLDALDDAIRRADTELRAARNARSAADARLAGVGREIAAAWEALYAARDPLVALGAPAVTGDDLLGAWTGLGRWVISAIAQRDAELPAAQAEAAAARQERDAAERRLADDLAAHGVSVRADRPLAEGVPAALAEALAGARAQRERIIERHQQAGQLRVQRAEAESAQQVAKMLGQLLRSDNFPRWLVASALDVLVADASESLSELSGGQFELAHEDGEFLVVDHTDADARRPVKTLSGGETFQTSLALALALSAQLSALAAQGAARLDSIFLDEGFGTLDEATLDVVAGTLENLANRGGRMVGVITHVPALAERVPVRFSVTRDQRSASVIREGS